MIVITDVSVPADAFPLGRVLDEYRDIEIELERLVPLSDALIPLFWVDDGTADRIEATLEADDLTKSVQRLTQTGSRVLYEIEWEPDINGLIEALQETDARILEAEGTADVWDFRLQFPTHNALSAFRDACDAKDIPLTLRRLYNPALPEEGGKLSALQHEALMTAYQGGYYEIPRSVAMASLADQLGITDSAFSQRLRRGTGSLIGETLIENSRGANG